MRGASGGQCASDVFASESGPPPELCAHALVQIRPIGYGPSPDPNRLLSQRRRVPAAQHSTAQDSTAQHSTAQQSISYTVYSL